MSDRSNPLLRGFALVAIVCVLAAAASGCSFIRSGVGGSVVDAHVIYRTAPGCTFLVARTLRNGYTLMQPLDLAEETGFAPLPALEVSGIFEGPVREGESVFRYTAPSSSDTWQGEDQQLVINVLAVGLDLQDSLAQLATACATDSAEPS